MRRLSIKSLPWQAVCMCLRSWDEEVEYQDPTLASFMHESTELGMKRLRIKSQPWQAFCMSLRSWDEEDVYQEPALASFLHESTELR
jgi:hypothetical protein